MDKNEFDNIVRLYFRDSGLPYQTYASTRMINMTDVDGIVQSYYASTGTAVFRDGNNKYRQKRVTVHDMPPADFVLFCKSVDDEHDIMGRFFANA